MICAASGAASASPATSEASRERVTAKGSIATS